jgi:toxin CptA
LSVHNAPAISYFAGRPSWLGGLLVLFGLTTIALSILWYLLTRTADWRHAVTFGAAVLALAALTSSFHQVPHGMLNWDRQVWSWTAAVSFEAAMQRGNAVDLQAAPVVIADFQQCLLVRITASTNAVDWLWLERRRFPERWLDLRRAIYSQPRENAAVAVNGIRPDSPGSTA